MASLLRAVHAPRRHAPVHLTELATRTEVDEHLLDDLLRHAYEEPSAQAHSTRKTATWLRFLADPLHTGNKHHVDTRDLAWWELKFAVPSWVHAVSGGIVLAVALCVWWAGAGTAAGPFDLFTGGGLLGIAFLTFVGRFGMSSREAKPPKSTAVRRRGHRGFPQLARQSARMCAAMVVVFVAVLLSGGLAVQFLLRAGGMNGRFASATWNWLTRGGGVSSTSWEATTPGTSLRDDRTATLLPAFTFLILGKLPLVGLWTLGPPPGDSEVLLAVAGLIDLVGTFLCIGMLIESAWWSTVIARGWLALRGLIPLQLMRFLEDARERGILRRSGAVYQFRHAQLQDHIRTRR